MPNLQNSAWNLTLPHLEKEEMDGGETDGADLEPGSAWKRLDAPSLLPMALAFELAKPKTALKSFSDRPGPRTSTPGTEPGGPGGQGCGSPEPSLTVATDAHCQRGLPLPDIPLRETPRFPPCFATGQSWHLGQATEPLKAASPV